MPHQLHRRLQFPVQEKLKQLPRLQREERPEPVEEVPPQPWDLHPQHHEQYHVKVLERALHPEVTRHQHQL